MAKWLPYHEDRFFLNLGAAVWGQYRAQYKPENPTPETDEDRARAANRALDAWSPKADRAMQAYQAKKAARRR